MKKTLVACVMGLLLLGGLTACQPDDGSNPKPTPNSRWTPPAGGTLQEGQ